MEWQSVGKGSDCIWYWQGVVNRNDCIWYGIAEMAGIAESKSGREQEL